MRFLGVTETCDLAALYLRLQAAGHEVRVAIEEEKARGTLAGLVAHSPDWRRELDWVRAAGAEGIILFEAVSDGLGALQDSLRADGFNVVGGSAFGDRLENDRAFAQQRLADLGLAVAGTWEFSSVAHADAFIAARPGRYVLKFSGPGFASSDNHVGTRPDGADIHMYPRTLLLSHASTASLHSLGMEWKEHVALLAPLAFTAAIFLLMRCRRALREHPPLRLGVLVFAATALFATGIAGLTGAFLNKAAPVTDPVISSAEAR